MVEREHAQLVFVPLRGRLLSLYRTAVFVVQISHVVLQYHGHFHPVAAAKRHAGARRRERLPHRVVAAWHEKNICELPTRLRLEDRSSH